MRPVDMQFANDTLATGKREKKKNAKKNIKNVEFVVRASDTPPPP
jgi:hypothetical protein